jgi:hypothetical protein
MSSMYDDPDVTFCGSCGFETRWYSEQSGWVDGKCACDEVWEQVVAERDVLAWGLFDNLADVVSFWNDQYESQQSEIAAEKAWLI